MSYSRVYSLGFKFSHSELKNSEISVDAVTTASWRSAFVCANYRYKMAQLSAISQQSELIASSVPSTVKGHGWLN